MTGFWNADQEFPGEANRELPAGIPAAQQVHNRERETTADFLRVRGNNPNVIRELRHLRQILTKVVDDGPRDGNNTKANSYVRFLSLQARGNAIFPTPFLMSLCLFE